MERKKILFVTSEAVPFIKTGGLADVAGTLPKYFNNEKYDVRVILPKYLCIKPQWQDKIKYLTHFEMDMAWRKQHVGIFSAEIDGITFYFIDNEFYFAGDRPYIFVKHIYACAALVGAIICRLLWNIAGSEISMVVGFAVIIIIRLLAVKFHWNLPTAKEVEQL